MYLFEKTGNPVFINLEGSVREAAISTIQNQQKKKVYSYLFD
jgi:hypothetical protein